MSAFVPDLPAPQAHAHLQTALVELQNAEQHAVLWFYEINARKLYRELGYSSIHQYGTESLGFSAARTFQFLRRAERLQALPQLRESVASGEVPWTKARVVAGVATPATEKAWVEEAKTASRRDLERKIAAAKDRAKVARRRTMSAAQTNLGEVAAQGQEPSATQDLWGGEASSEAATLEAMVEITLRFTPEEAARMEALLERAHKRGETGKREDLILAGLDALGGKSAQSSNSQPIGTSQCTRVQSETIPESDTGSRSAGSPYHVHILLCPECEKATFNTTTGTRPVSLVELETILCDAIVDENGKNKATIPPRIRRQVMARDRHRCRAAGCGRTHFLNVHHVIPREKGGANRVEGLITLCSGCHRTLHKMGERRALSQGGRWFIIGGQPLVTLQGE